MSQMRNFMTNAPNEHNHSHSHNHNHSHDHNHSHNHSHDDHDDDHENNGIKSKSSCGYMPIDQIKKLNQQRKNEPTMEEKNKKKKAAVYAAKEDGNRLFKEKNYKLAYKVYERGVLIINGMYQLSEEDEDEMENIECLLDLNMALVSLKMEDWTEAINCCKMAIQIDDKNAKSYYRWSEALIGMSEYDKARQQSLKAKQLQPKNVAMDKQLSRIDKLQKQQIEKAKKQDQKIAKRMQKQLNKQQQQKENGK